MAEHESRQATAWGVDLLTGAMRRAPMPAGDPAASPRATMGRPAYRAPLGAVAGLCWDEAVQAGLLAHFEALPALWRDADAPCVDPVRESGGDEGVLSGVRLLARTGEVFGFRDHSAAAGLPAYTVTAGHEVVARSVALTPAQALRHAAEHTLLSWQARVEGRPEAVPPSRRWAAGGPGTDVLAQRLLDATGSTPWSYRWSATRP